MQTPVRLAAKFLLRPDPTAPPDLHPFIGLFHRFIQQKSLPGLLLDVADYAHVPDGPGVILIGHEVDYGIDSVGGRTGLLTTHKRHTTRDFEDVVKETLRMALVAARAIEADGSTGVHFDTSAVTFQLIDRLRTPNTDAAFEAARAALSPVAEKLFAGGYEAARENGQDPRQPLAIRLRATDPADADTLLGRLGGA